MKKMFLVLFLFGCCKEVTPPPPEKYKPEPDCARDGQHAVCTEAHEGSKIYIDTYDVLATKETFDPKYRFYKPSHYVSQYTFGYYPPKEMIPESAQLIAKSDGWIWWHWSKAQQ